MSAPLVSGKRSQAQVEDRLAETWEALAVQRVINEQANKEVNPELNATLNMHPGFWRIVNFSLQTSIFVGLFALLDRNLSSASMYSILKHAKHKHPDPSIEMFEADLDRWRNKYAKYRHKIFGHNDQGRNDVIAEFNAEGFTWKGLEDDVAAIDHIWKTIWLLHRGNPAPDKEYSTAMQFPHNSSRLGVIEHTNAFLRTLLHARKGA